MSPAIIIFGAAVRSDGAPSGAMRGRVEAALRCARSLDAPLFLPTGGRGRFGPSEAEVMARLLREAGVPDAQILIEPTGTNTIRSVLACARLLRGRGWAVWVSTSDYHLPRCLVLLRLAGLQARGCRPPRQPASSSRAKRWMWRLREIPALPIDSGLMLWFRIRRLL